MQCFEWKSCWQKESLYLPIRLIQTHIKMTLTKNVVSRDKTREYRFGLATRIAISCVIVTLDLNLKPIQTLILFTWYTYVVYLVVRSTQEGQPSVSV